MYIKRANKIISWQHPDNTKTTMLKYFFLWFPMLLIAILNGTIRELFFRKYLNELTAHQLSTFTLLLFFFFYTRFVIHRFMPPSAVDAIMVGVFWLSLTLAFEFGFGRWRGNTWVNLLADYDLRKGRLWVLIPLFITIAPYFFYKFKTG